MKVIFFSLLGTISSPGPGSFITAALVADLPEVGLSAGEVGAIVGQLGIDAFEVEFVDAVSL